MGHDEFHCGLAAIGFDLALIGDGSDHCIG